MLDSNRLKGHCHLVKRAFSLVAVMKLVYVKWPMADLAQCLDKTCRILSDFRFQR